MLLMLVLAALCSADVTVNIGNHWPGGFQARFCIAITVELHTWKVHLKFDRAVDDIETGTANVQKVDGQEFILSNKAWNQNEHVGDDLCLDVVAKTDGNFAPAMTASVEGMDTNGTTGNPGNNNNNQNTNNVVGGTTPEPTVPIPEYVNVSHSGVGGGEEVTTNKLHIYNDWGNRFEGELVFPITENVEGWEVQINFSQPVDKLDLWIADVFKKSPDGKTWTVINKQDKVFVSKGSTLKLRFFGNTQASKAPSAVATLTNLGHDDNGFPNVKNTAGTKFNYDEVLYKSILFYETQRSGKLPDSNRIPWRGDSALGDKGDNGEDLTGGWYDAGDHVKFNLPMSWSTTILTWSLLQWEEAYREAGQYDNMLDSIKWPLDYLLKCHTAKDELYVQLWIADVFKKSPDGKTWTVINKQDKVFVSKGSTLKLRFFGNTQASKAPSAVATLTNLGHDDNGFPNVKNTAGTKFNYDEVLYKSILFYETQRSGKLPDSNRIPWRGDSALGDKGDNGEDLTGGWYDAGDHVKFNLPMSWSTTILTWSLLQWEEAYREAGQYDNMLDSIKWPLDYLLKCHTAKDELYVQVGDGGRDHSYWGRPEDMTMTRPAYKITPSKPGSDVACQTAAAMAAGYMAFRTKNATYAQTLLNHSVQLYDFAMANKGRYSQSVSAAQQFYPSTNNTDEHAWAGLWLYQATGDPKYLEAAEKDHQPGFAWGLSWDDNQAANNVLFYKLTGKDIYKQDMEDTFEKYWFPNQVIKYTPKGLAWRLQWGSLRYASNMALVALMGAEAGLNPDKYREWAASQIHYALGDTGFSFLVGFGNDFPHSPHHRSGSCPWPPAPCGPQVMSSHAPNVHTVYGALVGGPDDSDGYKDDRANYVNNEVACDYNAGFQAAVAGLRSLAVRQVHPEQLQTTNP